MQSEHLATSNRQRNRAGRDTVVTVLALVATFVLLRRETDRLIQRADALELDVAGLRISLEGARTLGATSAPTVMVQYIDFQCPFSAEMATGVLPTVLTEYVHTGRVLLAVRHLPWKEHALARAAAQTAECAARQGKFWAMHDWLFARTSTLGEADVFGQHPEVGLHHPAFVACMKRPPAEALEEDENQAKKFGVTVTPTIILGTRVDGAIVARRGLVGTRTLDELRRVLEER